MKRRTTDECDRNRNIAERSRRRRACGEDLEYDPSFAEEWKSWRRETPERQYGDTIIPAEPPDWRGVKKAALTLLERTRDLRVAVYLARACCRATVLPGFAEGLALVEGLIERYWDGVYPLLDPDDDNDPTLRINTIVALCDLETTLRDLRETPLVSSRNLGRFSLRDVQVAAGVLTPVAGARRGTADPEPDRCRVPGCRSGGVAGHRRGGRRCLPARSNGSRRADRSGRA